jgi:transposase-like protein
MHQAHSPESSLAMIKRPRCPQCQIRMMLVGTEPSFAGPDLRTFECPKCELTYRALAADPMKSNKAAGWLKSELRAPE